MASFQRSRVFQLVLSNYVPLFFILSPNNYILASSLQQKWETASEEALQLGLPALIARYSHSSYGS